MKKMVNFELILNNTFRYQITVQAKIVVQVKNTNKRRAMKLQQKLIIALAQKIVLGNFHEKLDQL